LDSRLLAFGIVAGILSGVNLFLHKVAANRLEETSLGEVLRPQFLMQLLRNPYVYVVLIMGLLVLALDLAFLSNRLPGIVGLNFIIVLGNVLFAFLSVVVLGEKVDLRIGAGISFGILALILLSKA
jgi:hypothetical protein